MGQGVETTTPIKVGDASVNCCGRIDSEPPADAGKGTTNHYEVN